MRREAMNNPNHPGSIRTEQYEAIERALMQSAGGRWFLSEFARRNRATDTQVLLEAIGRLEFAVRHPRDSADLIRRDLLEMSEAITRTRIEIASIRSPGDERQPQISATEELDATVSATENATSEILAAAEVIQEILWRLREQPGVKHFCDAIQEKLTEIITACSFQDITGQRIQKVVQVLRFLEFRVDAMIETWGLDEAAIGTAATAGGPVGGPAENELLNGPQHAAHALKQTDVDSVIQGYDGSMIDDGGPDEVFDGADVVDSDPADDFEIDDDLVLAEAPRLAAEDDVVEVPSPDPLFMDTRSGAGPRQVHRLAPAQAAREAPAPRPAEPPDPVGRRERPPHRDAPGAASGDGRLLPRLSVRELESAKRAALFS